MNTEYPSCPHCLKVFDKAGNNTTNNNRHINACKKNPANIHTKRKGTILNYLVKKPCQGITPTVTDNSLDNDIVVGVTEEIVPVDVVETISVADEERNPVELSVIGVENTLESPAAITENVEMDVEDLDMQYCKGYQPNVPGNFFANFPFHLLPEHTFIVERDNLHDKKCADINYCLLSPAPENKSMNTHCYMLTYSNALKTLVKRAESVHDTTQNRYLTHSQLSKKLKTALEDRRNLKFSNYQLMKKNSQLGKSLSLHQRLIISVSENNVPRLTQLVNVALRRNRSIQYIVDKVKDVIDGIYIARASNDDKDLAYLVLKFGGPSLLDILYRANVLPSTSTAYRMAKKKKKIKSSVKMTQTQCFIANVTIDVDEEAKWTFSLKQDETCVTPKLRYNAINNEIVGTCYQHSHNVMVQFNEYEDAVELQKLIASDNVHVPKECLVTGITSLSNDKSLQIISAVPSCSKDDLTGTIKMNTEISKIFKETTGSNLMNFCTDGDSTRRRAFDAIMSHELTLDSEIGKTAYELPLVDTEVGQNDETVSFDPKHLAKRSWTSLISGKMMVGDTVISKKDLVDLLSLSPTIVHSAETLVYPKDKQNVPSAVDCLLSFSSVVKSDLVCKIPFRLTSVAKQLGLLADVFVGVLAFFVHTDTTIKKQINAFSKSAYVLFHLYRNSGTKLIPAQLYHDIQATFIDAIFCCIKMKIYCPSKPLFLVQNGTDILERFFGNVRLHMKTGLDALEMITCATAMAACDEIMTNHPDWQKGSRTMRRLCLDYSNPKEWNAEELCLANVDIVSEWKIGMFNANISLLSAKEEEVDAKNYSDQVSLMQPKGRKVGVRDVVFDWSMVEDEIEEVPSYEDGDVLCDLVTNEGVDPKVNIDGKFVYKATMLKDIMKYQDSLSKDRLKRVQGLTRHQPVHTDQMMDNMVFIGDPIIIKRNDHVNVANISKIYNGTSEVGDIGTDDITNDQVKLCVKILNLKEIDNNLYWDGSFKSENEISILGKNCMLIQPEICVDPPPGMSKFCFDKQSVMDIGVHLSLSIPNAESTTSLHKCKVCRKRVDLKEMRMHVGKHIIEDEIATDRKDITCGFCGLSCSSNLVKTSRGKNKDYYGKIESTCNLYYDYGKVGSKPSRNNACTNTLRHCSVTECNQVIWSYNMTSHFDIKHPDILCDVDITPADISAMKKKK